MTTARSIRFCSCHHCSIKSSPQFIHLCDSFLLKKLLFFSLEPFQPKAKWNCAYIGVRRDITLFSSFVPLSPVKPVTGSFLCRIQEEEWDEYVIPAKSESEKYKVSRTFSFLMNRMTSPRNKSKVTECLCLSAVECRRLPSSAARGIPVCVPLPSPASDCTCPFLRILVSSLGLLKPVHGSAHMDARAL